MAGTDSEPAEVTLHLAGVWIMDPEVGEESVRRYLYGAGQREEDLDAMGEANFYAGRTDPVVDFGEHETYSFAVTVDIPHGPTWRTDVEDLRAFARAKRVLHVRDNRGRALYAYLERLRVRDQDWGSQASFTVVRADRVATLVVA